MIRRYSFALLLLSLFALPVVAQEANAPQRTAAPAESRFEIVQSELTVKFTVRLDKYTGQTWQIRSMATGELIWQQMTREDSPGDTVTIPGKVNYQVFASGLTLQDTFLLNVHTGATWQLFFYPNRDESLLEARHNSKTLTEDCSLVSRLYRPSLIHA